MAETIGQIGPAGAAARPADAFGRLLYRVCEVAALFGCAVLILLAATALISITGRACCAKPLPGDYELAQMLVAIAVVACLPYCQMRGGNVKVDFFTARLSATIRDVLDAVGAASVGLIGAVLAWRMCLGLLDLRRANDQSMILELPSWYPYVLVIPFFALLGVAGFYTAWRRLRPAPNRNRA
jgi:TRAP-type C4-dicarboxylate transport system permease small subunit